VLKSRLVLVSIARPYREVYDFLANPRNFPRWGTNFGSEMEHVSGRDWLVEVASSRAVLRFPEPNAYGVLDYVVFPPGQSDGPVRPARAYPNQEGTDLVLTLFQWPGVSDEQFASEEEWLRSDLARLKTLLETQP
jgi:hypothetical protein